MNSSLGAEVVYESRVPTIDIIFVHGLNGHRSNTWTYHSKDSESKRKSFLKSFQTRLGGNTTKAHPLKVFWPADLLPSVVPDSRIITYGYDAKLLEIFQSVSQNSLYAISRELTNDIQLIRQTEEQAERPILWITHSLGGIVLKDALVYSNSLRTKSPHLHTIYNSTKGIIYFGCPHRGSDSAQYGLIAASAAQALLQAPNKRLLHSLRAGSSELERIADSFSLLPKKANQSLLEFSFQEEKGMASAIPVLGGKVVPDSSSKIDDSVGNTSSLAANHRDMCRFAGNDNRDFQRVAGVVRRFCRDISAAEISKGQSGSSISGSDSKVTLSPLRDQSNPGIKFKSKSEAETAYPSSASTKQGKQISPATYLHPMVEAGLKPDELYLIHDGWTKISKTLVSPDAFDSVNEDYIDSGRYLQVQRKMSRAEIYSYAERSQLNTPQEMMPTYGRNVNLFFDVPLSNNPFFTGRQHQLSKLDEIMYPLSSSMALNPQLRCALLVGLGGCGKTEIAVRYAHIHRKELFAILWIDGTSRSSLQESLIRIAKKLQGGLSGRHHDAMFARTNSSVDLITDFEDALAAQSIFTGNASLSDLIKWLNSFHHRYDWLIIIDNMDDPKMVSIVEDLLAQLNRGLVLITTRNSRASRLGSSIDIGELEAGEAFEFLLRSVKLWEQSPSKTSYQKQAESLCRLLGYLALAIDQAAAYVNENGLTIDEYISLFQQEKTYLLGMSSQHRYSKTRSTELDKKYDTVMLTWEISFRYIERESPVSALLLQLLAIMDYEIISEALFEAIYVAKAQWEDWSPTGTIIITDAVESEPVRKLVKGMDSKPKFHEAVGKLLSFSLVKRAAQSRCLSIHPLVHFWTSVRMTPQEKTTWVNFAARLLRGNIPIHSQLPLFEPSRSRLIPVILPHIQSVYQHSKESEHSDVTSDVVELLLFGAYHSQRPLADQMFQYIRSTRANLAIRSLLLCSNQELSYFCYYNHYQYNRNDAINTPADSTFDPCLAAAELIKKLIEKSTQGHTAILATENALLLQLAVTLSLHYQHAAATQRDLKLAGDMQRPFPQQLTEFIQTWKPSEAIVEIEIATKPLKDLYICTFIKPDYKMPQEVSSQGERLVRCFTDLHSISRFCYLLSNALLDFAANCNTQIAATIIERILKTKRSGISAFGMWIHLPAPIATMCLMAQRNENIDTALGTLSEFKEAEYAVLVARNDELATPLGQANYNTQWDKFLVVVRSLLPCKNQEFKLSVLGFLGSFPRSRARGLALEELVKMSSKEGIVSYAD